MDKHQQPPIVVVDDDFEHLDLVVETLTRASYRCLGFTSARDALIYITQSPVDLVVTDIFMPEMDGFEMLRTLRLAHPDLRIITLSGEGRMTKDFYLGCAMRLGAVAALRKPFDPNALIEIVAQHVGHGANKSATEGLLQSAQQQPHSRETGNAKT